jgi:peptide/nickel transport system substrate-binding protein
MRVPRLQVIAAGAIGVGLIAAGCSSSSGSKSGSSPSASVAPSVAQAQVAQSGGFGTLPTPSTTKVKGGVVKIAQSPGAGPNYIFPITPAANGSVYNIYQLQNQLFAPLYQPVTGTSPKTDYSRSVGKAPVFSDGNKTVTVALNTTFTWSDGKPVVADDVVFFVDLLKAAVKESPANFGNYTPGFFPDNVASMTTPDTHTVVFHLTKAFNPQWFQLDQLGFVTPLPSTAWNRSSTGGPALDYTKPANAKAIYDYLAKQATDISTYATNPLWKDDSGPFTLTSFNASTDANVMKANAKYTGPNKPSISEIDQVAFTSDTAEFNQLLSGQLDVGAVPSADLPQVAALKRKGYNVYGYPDFGFDYILFNFKDTTGDFNKIISQLYVRQALAHLQDQAGIVEGIYHNAASQAYGPVPSLPVSPFTPANASTNPYPFSIATASKLLSSHGWKVVPNGQTTCTSAGTGPTDCGAGIPAGTPLKWNIYYSNAPATTAQQITALSSAAKQIGITITSTSKTFNYLIQNFSDVSAKSNIDKWAMMDFGGFSINNYPTTNEIFNTTGSYDFGGYSDPKADALINNSVYGSDPNAVSKEAAYLTTQLPALFQPLPDSVVAWKSTLSGPQDSFSSLTQYRLFPEFWYFTQKQ